MNLEAQPHRFSSCDRHPDDHFTGFCPSCLRERLEGLETAIIRKNSSTSTTATSALKSIFRGSGGDGVSSRSKASSSFLPELRRCKSFSGGKGEGFSGVFEPKRKSCDVRARNTLWSLFNLADERNVERKEVYGEIEVETSNLGFSGVGDPVLEATEEEENEDEIKVDLDQDIAANLVEDRVEEIEEEQSKEQDVRTMKDHIDLDLQSQRPPGKDLKEVAGSFWFAASVFSKKLQKWRRKQKMKKGRRGGGSSAMQADKPAGRKFRETQSEIADYGFGRRSCDTDPRFSLDAGRISFDDPRYSLDEPRASWDGYLIGKVFPRLPPMVEDVPVPVRRSDAQISVEEPMDSINEESTTPGGSPQTRDYYSDSSSPNRCRRSIDRSSSTLMATAEVEDTKSASNSKVSPAIVDYLNRTKLLDPDRDSNSNSLRSFESTFREDAFVADVCEKKGTKRSRRWSKAWNIWGFIHWRRSSKDDEDDEIYNKGNVIERSFSESWPELRREAIEDANGSFNKKFFRSNSSVRSRNSLDTGNYFGSIRSYAEINGGHGKKKIDEFVLERNQSARYSPSRVDNGLLGFYLTPLRSSRRNGSGKSRPKSSHSIARSVLRLY